MRLVEDSLLRDRHSVENRTESRGENDAKYIQSQHPPKALFSQENEEERGRPVNRPATETRDRLANQPAKETTER
jgi:hypothetical protein